MCTAYYVLHLNVYHLGFAKKFGQLLGFNVFARDDKEDVNDGEGVGGSRCRRLISYLFAFNLIYLVWYAIPSRKIS